MDTAQVIIEEFCTKYKNFKNARPTAQKAELREAFDSICSSLYTKFASEMPALDIHNIEDFKSFIPPNLKKRREITRLRNEEKEIYFEIQQQAFAIEKAMQEKEIFQIRQEFDQQPTFPFH
jgi:hypothetical protein